MLPASNQGLGENIGFPDVCNTPAPSGTVPITYPNTGSNATGLPMTPTIMVSMVPGHNQTAKPSLTNGDNAGVAHSSFMQSGGNNCGNVKVLMSGSPAETLANPTQGNNYNCSTDAKLVPSITTVLMTFCRPGHTDATVWLGAPGSLRRPTGLALGAAPLPRTGFPPEGPSDATIARLFDQPTADPGWTLIDGEIAHLQRGGAAERLGLRRGDRPTPADQTRLRSLRPSVTAPVTAHRCPDGVGMITIHRFSVGAPALVRRALHELRSAPALVLDLRGCPGGLLAVAADVAGQLLGSGRVVATASLPLGEQRYVTTGRRALSQPLVVLVDGQTASAGEVLSACLQEAGAVVVGAPTFGKLHAESVFGASRAVPLRGSRGALLTAVTPQVRIPPREAAAAGRRLAHRLGGVA